MKTIAIVNLKGGVGKTVTAVNVAYILAKEHKKRVLLIDADSQCNTSDFFHADPAQGNLAEVLTAADGAFGLSFIQSSGFERLDILPASDALMDLDLTKISDRSVNANAICELLSHVVETDGDYDYVLVDCAPAFNAASAAALLAVMDVIIPIKLDAFSLRGMANLMRQVSNMRRINPRLRILGCLPTMYYPSQIITGALDVLYVSGLPVFNPKFARRTRLTA